MKTILRFSCHKCENVITIFTSNLYQYRQSCPLSLFTQYTPLPQLACESYGATLRGAT